MSKTPSGERFERLLEIMATLRGPDGCPWDREQDLDSLRPMLIEEVYEVIDAVDRRDYAGLAEELGDLLLHVVFHARLGEELGAFTIDDALDGVCDKLVRRHPHVFGDESAESADEVVANWEEIKKQEKLSRRQAGPDAESAPPSSVLDGIPPTLPALNRAHKISSKVVRVGFEWPDLDAVFAKLDEEVAELKEAISRPESERSATDIELELGDAFFVMVNIARRLGLDSESALKKANRKFESRFRRVESLLRTDGIALEDAGTEALEDRWQRVKQEGA